MTERHEWRALCPRAEHPAMQRAASLVVSLETRDIFFRSENRACKLSEDDTTNVCSIEAEKSFHDEFRINVRDIRTRSTLVNDAIIRACESRLFVKVQNTALKRVRRFRRMEGSANQRISESLQRLSGISQIDRARISPQNLMRCGSRSRARLFRS
jgi:hypothetical protein